MDEKRTKDNSIVLHVEETKKEGHNRTRYEVVLYLGSLRGMELTERK